MEKANMFICLPEHLNGSSAQTINHHRLSCWLLLYQHLWNYLHVNHFLAARNSIKPSCTSENWIKSKVAIVELVVNSIRMLLASAPPSGKLLSIKNHCDKLRRKIKVICLPCSSSSDTLSHSLNLFLLNNIRWQCGAARFHAQHKKSRLVSFFAPEIANAKTRKKY